MTLPFFPLLTSQVSRILKRSIGQYHFLWRRPIMHINSVLNAALRVSDHVLSMYASLLHPALVRLNTYIASWYYLFLANLVSSPRLRPPPAMLHLHRAAAPGRERVEGSPWPRCAREQVVVCHDDWVAHLSWTHRRDALLSAGNDGRVFYHRSRQQSVRPTRSPR